MLRLKGFLILLMLCSLSLARKHHLEVRDDTRRYIALSTFGFYQSGILDVKLSNFVISNENENDLFGLSLDKTTVDAMNPYLDSHQNKCILDEPASAQRSGPIIFFLMDLKNLKVSVTCSSDWRNLHIYKDRSQLPAMRAKRQSKVSDSALFMQRRKKREFEPREENAPAIPSENKGICKDLTLPLTRTLVGNKNYYNTSFSMFVASPHEEGLYNLYFHACPNYHTTKELSFNVDIEENNNGNFLSAGEMPLPALYFMMSLLFFLSGLFWVFILKKSKHSVFKIHYIMAVLVFLKSLSLMFHAINYHFIEIRGEHVETWAILYYVTHLLKGAVLFITILLIGTGWTFIKHILNDKDKKIFMIVIPLQILANVAEIIIAESEESDVEYRTWRDIFILVDLLCCGAILFPVVWSIRHLHEASATDGKAAINLRKLKLFRQFYIMIVCYIYFTRIIVYLLKITVAFQYAWLDEMFHEMATYVFFVLTGYKFRPASSHPYFSVSDEDDDDEVEVLTESGLTAGLHKTKALNRNAPPTTTIVEGNDEERENLISKRESSHEYD
ncbi:protein GPR107 [Eupeodes corollae]|uniref:protein GPR107 n=1 Tax=Eupeodes corollae TaxID=290404 RepID=UPI00248FCD26|nr:protein GPR107 [Eupeodes corollae]